MRFTPLDYAVQGKHEEVIRTIQRIMTGGKSKGSSEVVAEDGPLSFKEPNSAAREKMVVPEGLRPELQKACESVRRKGWSKIQWPKGFTALHLAAQLGSFEVVMFLLEASASVSLHAPDAKGFTPMDYAARRGQSEIVELLKKCEPKTAAPAEAASRGKGPGKATGKGPPGKGGKGPPCKGLPAAEAAAALVGKGKKGGKGKGPPPPAEAAAEEAAPAAPLD